MSTEPRMLQAHLDRMERQATDRDEDFRTFPDSWHTRQCGYGQGELLEDCACEVPGSVVRLVGALRRIIDLHHPDRDPCDAHDASYESIPCEVLEELAVGLGLKEEGA